MWRNIFNDVGRFNETMITCEDAELGYRIGARYKLYVSDSIKIRHLGENKTLKTFFLKELWRGTSNLHGFFIGANKRRDFLSVFVPIVYTLMQVWLLVALIFSCVFKEPWWYLTFVLNVLVLIVPPMTLAIRKSKGWMKPKDLIKVSIISYVYLLARGLAIFKIKKKH